MVLSTEDLDNDTRGWILCVISGIACIFGASVICVDVIVRLFPGKQNFRIEESNVFLACSLSLSFGVMIFSSLFSMLPESKGYLKKAEWSDQSAGLVMMGCFVGGFIGIQTVSRFLHQHVPTHVVDCDHTHEEQPVKDGSSCQHGRRQSRASRARRRFSQRTSSRPRISKSTSHLENGHANGSATESTPLLASENSIDTTRLHPNRSEEMSQQVSSSAVVDRKSSTHQSSNLDRRGSSIAEVQKQIMSFVQDKKRNCDESGSCYGYTDPCGQECFKHIGSRSSKQLVLRTTTGSKLPHSDHCVGNDHAHSHNHNHENGSVASHHDHDHSSDFVVSNYRTSRATSRDPLVPSFTEDDVDHASSCSSTIDDDNDLEAQHHHHVPTNAFLSIGLQTSIAIALHKFPEGFITYATNHANPDLGFNVFMALFVHNITEGFAMCLPLYMALGSRWKAMAWSACLGGLSQPFGAGLAVLWFKLASRTHMTPNAVAYACLFAITSGIMVSVALQLFVEGLSLSHNRNLCIFFAFLGMALLGVSNALVGSH